jgi:hypothetical protein
MLLLAMFAILGGPIILVRSIRDARRRGQISVHDGRLLRAPSPTPTARVRYAVTREAVGEGARIAVHGVELSEMLGFRLEGRTHRTSERLEGRLIVEGTKGSSRARRLFARSDVQQALASLCGAEVPFRRVDLFPYGLLVVAVGRGDLEDATERLLQFAEVIDAAAPHLEHDDVDLGATSGNASSAAFSIEIRS